MPATHKATFTWPGTSANTVFVTGAWDNWSGNSHALEKQSDGGFVGHVELPFGQTYSYKYVVDGEWKTREDEAKEWDAAGNMNNVYTAPAESTEAVQAPAAAAAAVPATTTESEAPAAETESPPPPTTAPDSTVLPTEKSTPSESLLSSTAPGPATGLTAPAGKSLDAFGLGAPIAGGGVSKTATNAFTPAEPVVAAGQPVAIHGADVTTATTAPVEIRQLDATPAAATEETAATGESPLQQYAAQAAALGGGALAALGAGAIAVGGAVEKVTGIDVIHHPMSVDAAKKAGIDIQSLEKVDAPTHTATGTSPVPASAVDALEEKIQAVKLDADKALPSASTSTSTTVPSGSAQKAVPLPTKPEPKTSLPPSGSLPPAPKPESTPKPDLHAQADNAADHKSVPAPVIKTLSARDPAKDRTSPATDDAKDANKPISTDPSVSAKDAKAPTPPAKTDVAPASAPAAVVPAGLAANTPVAPPAPVEKPVAPAAPVQNPTAVAQAQGVPAATAQPPQTPTKTAAAATAGLASPGSALSTPAGTPQKAAHGREATTDSDKIRKRKSSFFAKIKERFSSSSPGKEK